MSDEATKDPAGGEEAGVWCLVANVKEQPYRDRNPYDTRAGTRHFSPGTKCYVYPAAWGDGGEKLRIWARHRGSRRLVCMVIASRYLTNWRAQREFNPFLIREFTGPCDGATRWTEDEARRVAAMRNGSDDDPKQGERA